jgi:hypothetical protein
MKKSTGCKWEHAPLKMGKIREVAGMRGKELFPQHILDQFREKAFEETIEAERNEYEREFEFEEVE